MATGGSMSKFRRRELRSVRFHCMAAKASSKYAYRRRLFRFKLDVHYIVILT